MITFTITKRTPFVHITYPIGTSQAQTVRV